MKKSFMAVTFTLFVLVGMITSNANATSLDVEGFVTPDMSSIVVTPSGGTNFVTLDLRYDFVVAGLSGGVKLDILKLKFEQDIFTSVGIFTGYDPGDWSYTGSLGEYEFSSGGSPIGLGGRLSFDTTVTMYQDALTQIAGDWDSDTIINNWSEGQIWAQSFVAGDTNTPDPFGFGIITDGGSTVPTPEPASLILMGSGLVGLGLWGRRRSKKA